MNTYSLIEHKLLLEVLDYNKETGVFTWKLPVSKKSVPGRKAGSTNKILGYVVISVCGYKTYGHRLAWYYVYGEMPEGDIDHINGIKDDNRICNLRKATRSQNMYNLHKSNKNNKLGILGVHHNGSSYLAKITVNGKTKHLGSFATKEEAHERYMQEKFCLTRD
jgi:hemin uptake protein HemP